MADPIYEFQAPNGVVYQISGAPDEGSARRRAREYFREEFPDQFAEWSRNRPLPGFGSAFVQSARGAAGAPFTGAGLIAEETGLPGGQTLRDVGSAISGQPLPGDRLLEADTVLEDLRRRPLQTLATGAGQAIGGVLGSVAAPAALVAGTAALAPAGAGVAAGAGAAIGAGALFGALSGTSELYEGLVREGVSPERARELAATAGPIIGAAEGGAAGPVIRQLLGNTLRREAVERITEIAGRSAGQQAARGGARAAGFEGVAEGTAGAARQAVIAAETGQADVGRRAGEALFEGVLGAVGGGVAGAVGGARDPGRARAELEARLTPEERAARDAELEASIRDEAPPVAPAPEGPAPLVGERPQPFAAPEQAVDYLAANPPPTGLRTPEAAAAWANARREAEWESQVEAARPTALAEFTTPPTTPEAAPQANQTFFGNIAEAAVTDQIRLTGFKPQDVARYAFESRGIQKVKPSDTEIQAVTQRLDSLVASNLLERTEAGTYRVSTQATPAAPVAPAPAQPAVPVAGAPPQVGPLPPAPVQAVPVPGAPPQAIPLPTPAPTPTPPPPSAAESTETPETQRAQQSLAEIAQTGNPASPPSPATQISAALWTGYSLAYGPEANNPVVIAAREVAKASRRLTLNEFQSFANTWTSLPSDVDRLVFTQQAAQNPGLLSGRPAPAPAPMPAPMPTAAPTPAPAPPMPQPMGAAAGPLPGAATVGPPPQPTPAPAPMPVPPAPAAAAAPNAAPEVTQAETAQAAPEAVAQEGTAPETQPDQGQPPPEAIAQDTSEAAATDIRNTSNGIYAGMVGMLPDNPTVGKQTIERTMNDTFFNKTLRGFASPLLSMPKLRAELSNVAGVSRFEGMRFDKTNNEVQSLFARDFDKVPEQEIPAMTRALIKSSTDRKPADTTGLSPATVAKIQDTQLAFQRVFDAFIESNVIKNFDPREAANQADANRLNAMWEKHRGKSLLQIPANELRQASKTGFDQMQELNALRNPYYFPMTSGSKEFFIAAYPKGADGKRKPGAKAVKIIPIDAAPSGALSAGAPDPVAAAREELERLGITDRTHYITPNPIEFTRDKVASDARDSADVLAPFFKMLQATVGNNAEARRLITDMQSALSKASIQSILRPNQGILHPITSINETSYFTSTIPNYAAGINKLQARRYTEHSFERSIKDLPRADQEYWRTYRDYNSAPNEAAWINIARTINFHKYMGGAIDSMFANAFQVYTGTMPILMRDSGSMQGAQILQNTINQVFAKFKTTGRAAASKNFDTYLTDVIKQLARNPKEAKALAEAARLGVFSPTHTLQLGGTTSLNIEEGLRRRGIKSAKKTQDALETLLNLSGLPQRTVETVNRLSAFLAAYRLAETNPTAVKNANFFDKTDFKGPSANFYYAVSRVDDTQYLMGREDRALFTRSFPGAELVFQFQTYAFKASEMYLIGAYNVVKSLKAKDPQLAKAAAIGFLSQTATLVALVGVWGLPFALVLRELYEAIVKLIWKDSRNLDDELREATGDSTFAKILTRGLLHTSGVMAASQRMGVNPIPYEEISSWNPLQIFGPMGGSFIDDVINTYGYLSKNDYWNAAASTPITPRVVGNALRGVNLEVGTQEYRTPRGDTTISREQIEKLDQQSLVPISIRQGLGFGSPGIADLRDADRLIREVERQNQDYGRSLTNNLARAEVDRIRAIQSQDAGALTQAIAAYERLLREHAARNEAYERAGERDKMYNPNMAAIRRQAMQMLYGRASPEVVGQRGGPSTRGEIQEILRRYSPLNPQ